jgi:hypothetical protein
LGPLGTAATNRPIVPGPGDNDDGEIGGMIGRPLDGTLVQMLGRAVAGFPPRRPGFPSGQHMGFVVDKAAMGQVSSEYFSLPCQ